MSINTLINRRALLATLGTLPLWQRPSMAQQIDQQPFRPLVGAIRWDAWYAPGTVPTSAMEKSLAPQKYRWRLPFFAHIDPEAEPTLPPLSQAVMDLEIRQANYAGLDYWAFVAYGETDPMSSALSHYLASPNRDQIKFCMFSELSTWGSVSEPAKLVTWHVELMKRPEYARVADGRPLYYLGFIDNEKIANRWGGTAGLQAKIRAFRALAVASGAGNPYLVLAGSFSQIKDWASLGGDALGAYAISDPRGVGPYQSLARLTEKRWSTMSSIGLPIVPTVMAGWDRRPRVEHPVPWEHNQKPGTGIEYHFEPPTPDELATHLQHAQQFISEQPTQQRAPTLLIYAWNENDEGGWLIPTAPCDTQRIEMLHRSLASRSFKANPECSLKR